MKKSFLLLAFLFCNFFCFSQLERTLHQTIDLTEYLNVRIDLHGDYELVHWPGNHFLIETNVKLYGASKYLMDYFIEFGRYSVEPDTVGRNAILKSKDKERKPLKYKGSECAEEVTVKVMVPDFFNILGAKALANDRLLKAGVTAAPMPMDSTDVNEVDEEKEQKEGEEWDDN